MIRITFIDNSSNPLGDANNKAGQQTGFVIVFFVKGISRADDFLNRRTRSTCALAQVQILLGTLSYTSRKGE